jgi:hypothetical protein
MQEAKVLSRFLEHPKIVVGAEASNNDALLRAIRGPDLHKH